jgi:hypothetical protein
LRSDYNGNSRAIGKTNRNGAEMGQSGKNGRVV